MNVYLNSQNLVLFHRTQEMIYAYIIICILFIIIITTEQQLIVTNEHTLFTYIFFKHFWRKSFMLTQAAIT